MNGLRMTSCQKLQSAFHAVLSPSPQGKHESPEPVQCLLHQSVYKDLDDDNDVVYISNVSSFSVAEILVLNSTNLTFFRTRMHSLIGDRLYFDEQNLVKWKDYIFRTTFFFTISCKISFD